MSIPESPSAIEAAGAERRSQGRGCDRPALEALIISEARSWIGTPYHHGADVKNAGVDCGMLLVRVFADCGLIPFFDPRPYPRDWHLHRSEERYLAHVFRHAVPVDKPGPGDVIVWRYGRTFSHGGIVTEWPLVVHAYHPSGVVEETDVSRPGPLSDARRERLYFRCATSGP